MDNQINQFLDMERRTPYLGNYQQLNINPNLYGNQNNKQLNLSKNIHNHQKPNQNQNSNKNKDKHNKNYNAFENKNHISLISSQSKLKKIINDSPFKSNYNNNNNHHQSFQQNVFNNKDENLNRSKNVLLHTFRKQKLKSEEIQIANNNEIKNQNKTYYFDNNNNNSFAILKDQKINKKEHQQAINNQIQKLNKKKLFNKVYTQESTKNCYSSDKLQTFLQKKIQDDKRKHPVKYLILGKQIGLDDSQIYKMKPAHLEFQLVKFTKNKGLQYLQDTKIKNRARSNANLPRSKTDDYSNPQKKYKNYIPQVFGKQQLKKIKAPSLQKIQKKSSISISVKPSVYINQKTSKLNALSSKQDRLGKQILFKVKKHFQEQKQIGHRYFDFVKSQQAIDQKLIEFLKAKIDRAQASLN